jgi:hypothetical protein|tara:strand:+ start:199 stop:576 length:378 start_codon:yes stop_codon:yes gene_type:complete
MNTLKKLIEGQFPLKKTFWLYGNIYPFFISLIIILTLLYFQENIKDSIVQQKFMNISFAAKIIIMLQGVIFFLYSSIATVGVWRSADKYEGKKFWKYLAKISILYAFYSYIQNALFLYESNNSGI